ncbi:Cys/Met metabolism PLP-dependent enzyme-domain-containing protein [Gorgonomyces haynaldii]|nr:Cys/Met metabolism PLP-dependent enzyme-domain-containing protein [Gorgonomyces haynaldii]
MPVDKSYRFGTVAIHAAQEPDPVTGAVIPPISLSTTFAQSAAGEHKGYDYSRSGNPTRGNFEKAVAALEGGKHGLAFASGSVTTATVTALLSKGEHLVSVNDVYGGTFRYFTKVLSTHGIDVSFVDLYDPSQLRKAVKKNTKMVWIETPTNPTLKLVDIKAIAEITKELGLLLVVDNTFMSSFFQQPLSLGADIVVHSVTKYLNGHSDVVMGVAVTSNDAVADRLKFLQNSIGGVPSPFDCFLAHRGLKTLHLRMQRHAENALAIAKFLEAHPLVERVIYPGLPSHPQHELAKRQQKGYGGMLSFRIKGGSLDVSNKFLAHLKLFALAESLGGIESLAELPAVMTHASVAPELRKELGITDNLIRISIGVEDVQDLIKDLDSALAHAKGKAKL